MGKEASTPGFLSKVVKFVRNPTTDWAELDQPSQGVDSDYSKEALKQMIERKRQNDFVRKREFDHLRKLRRREPVSTAEHAGRTSFFQSSLPPTNADERAQTLKKIDEIEAQMSRQWWKGKQEDGATPRAQGFPVTTSAPPPKPLLAPSLFRESIEPAEFSDSKFVPTQGASELNLASRWQDPGMEFESTEVHIPHGGPVLSHPILQPGGAQAKVHAAAVGEDVGAALFAVELTDSMTDPDLEEAAIRFANGDTAGAEAGLLTALQMAGERSELVDAWALALFDLYRATGQQERFDKAAQDVMRRFGRPAPSWVSMPEQIRAQQDAMQAGGGAAANHGEAAWTCPQRFGAADLIGLQTVLGQREVPCVLDWEAVESIAPDAVAGLGRVFTGICSQPLALVFRGGERLSQALERLTPSGERSVDQACWRLRMDALRAMQLQDDFELTALEYCVTYEMSPPSWQDAICKCQLETANRPASSGRSDAAAKAADAAPDIAHRELWGEVAGDAQAELTRIEAGTDHAEQIVISCERLVRVDFSAAGSILNWVTTQRGLGRQVQFREVSHIVAAFFNVIGINEHARLQARKD